MALVKVVSNSGVNGMRDVPEVVLDMLTVIDDKLQGVTATIEHNEWLERWEVTISDKGGFYVQDWLVDATHF